MTKERVNISIDSELLKKAKKHMPNLSAFIEECLRHYLGYAEGRIPVGNINEIADKIGKLNVELFLINQNYDAEESMKRVENEEKNKAWRFLWNDYRPRLIPDETLLEKAVEQLGKNEEELEDILDWVYMTDIKVDTNSWQDVLEKYEKYREDEF
ncbi:type II toxin-antitoxin system CcdA family antitoxin [Methanobrevibacter sp.]|uniref:type II toxin-antitoxin system CcdA family antitoxin n=1 Tax=Methanobrevibacter sp. TaxID=66852 RepID=UPI00388ED533